jgi:hypothetical protein
VRDLIDYIVGHNNVRLHSTLGLSAAQ